MSHIKFYYVFIMLAKLITSKLSKCSQITFKINNIALQDKFIMSIGVLWVYISIKKETSNKYSYQD